MGPRISALLVTIFTQAGAESTADGRSRMAKGAYFLARNLDGCTLRHSAVTHGGAGSVEIVVTTGAEQFAHHNFNSTLLQPHEARRTAELIKALISAGSDVMVQEADGWTPLNRAASCFSCNSDCIQTLLLANV